MRLVFDKNLARVHNRFKYDSSFRSILASVTELGFDTYVEELSGVLVSVGDTDGAAMDSDVAANHEVLGHEGGLAVALEDHLSLEEGTLGDASVGLLGLDDHDRLVFEEVVNEDGMNSEIFKSAFDNALFEVTVKAEDLYYN